MNFDFNTLITDRIQADVSYLSALLKKPLADCTVEELEKFNAGMLKGGYSWADLNRVTECMEYLAAGLEAAGYASGYSGIKIDREAADGLPEGYTELEYIASTGTQYINLGFAPTAEMTFEVDIDISSISGFSAIFGCRDKASQTAKLANILACSTATAIRRDYYGVSKSHTVETSTGRRKFLAEQNVLYINGEKTIEFDESSSESQLDMFLFAANNAGEPNYFIKGDLYSFSAKTLRKQVVNLIPCKSPNGVVGAYDLVSKKFMTSLGDDFIAGPEKPTVPAPDQPNPYRWYKEDTMTNVQMEKFLRNVNAIVSTLSLSPSVPTTMKKFTVSGANDIEKALKIVNETLEKLKYNMLPCGDAYCGGDFA